MVRIGTMTSCQMNGSIKSMSIVLSKWDKLYIAKYTGNRG